MKLLNRLALFLCGIKFDTKAKDQQLECLWCYKIFKRTDLVDDNRYCQQCYEQHITKKCQDCGTTYRFDEMASEDKRFCRWCYAEQNPFKQPQGSTPEKGK